MTSVEGKYENRLAENVRVIAQANELALSDFTYDHSSGQFSVSVDGEVLEDRWQFNLHTADGCTEDGGEGGFIQIDLNQNKYKLCTSGTGVCDEVELTAIKPSGAFMYFSFGGAGYLKMAQFHEVESELLPKSGSFMEVRDSFLRSFMSWGQCVPIDERD